MTERFREDEESVTVRRAGGLGILWLSRGVAQPGSAYALGAEGREFESLNPDHQLQVAQLDRATAF